MITTPQSRISLNLTAEEADALLQLLLESRVPIGVDESVVNGLLVQLAESLPGIQRRPRRSEKLPPLAACR